MTSTDTIRIRPAVVTDAETIVNLVRELAVYEKLEDSVRADADSIRRHLFGSQPRAEALMAEVEGRTAGFALFFHTFSTFRGQPGLYLEDVFVRPEFRGKGIGSRFFRELGRIAAERGCGRMEWVVLNWNTPAIDFYESRGARPLREWTTYRLEDEALKRLGE
jgi:GNAT superfamily N-acetyltransferase